MTPSLCFDRESRDRQVAAIAAYEGDIRTVQRSDEWQLSRCGHGAREICAHRMRDRVMHMQQVEFTRIGDFQHFRGQRERIWRVIEERIRSDLHFVKLDIRVAILQTNRLCVADEMDVVPAGGEFHSELGGDDARASVRWDSR